MALPLTLSTVHNNTSNTVQAESTLDAMIGDDSDGAIDNTTGRLRRSLGQLLKILDDWILEPLLTIRRFLHIVFLFAPVILTSPALVLGSEVTIEDTTGSIWWYDLLATRMEKAGPSFIKVSMERLVKRKRSLANS